MASEMLRRAVRADLATALDAGLLAWRSAAPPEHPTDAGPPTLALVTEAGALVLASEAAQAGALAHIAARLLPSWGPRLGAGDLVVTNDPFSGGTRIHDLFALGPLGGAVWLVALLPHPDWGGEALGGYVPEARELWVEGARITPVLLAARGRWRREVLGTLLMNTRLPRFLRHRLDALLGATTVVRDALASRHSLRGAEAFAPTLAHDRAAVLAALAPARSGEGRAATQWPGIGTVVIGARITGHEKGVTVDLSEVPDAVAANINSAFGNTQRAVWQSLMPVVPREVRDTGALAEAVRIVARAGSVADAPYPAATGFSPVVVGTLLGAAVATAARAAGLRVSLPAPWRGDPQHEAEERRARLTPLDAEERSRLPLPGDPLWT